MSESCNHVSIRLLLKYIITFPFLIHIIQFIVRFWTNCYVLNQVLERNISCCLLFSHNNPVWDLFAVQCSASKFSKVSPFPSIMLPLLHCVISIWFELSAKFSLTYCCTFFDTAWVQNIHVLNNVTVFSADLFLAVQNSSLGNLVTHWLTVPFIFGIQRAIRPRDLWPLRHLVRVMRRHDLTKNLKGHKSLGLLFVSQK